MKTLRQYLDATGPQLEALCCALHGEVAKLGFAADAVAIGGPEAAVYRLDRDPAAGTDSLCGEWRDSRGQRIGMLVCHADGSCYAEHDVVRVHPGDQRWFVEAVHAWGRDDRISAEPRLMPMVS